MNTAQNNFLSVESVAKKFGIAPTEIDSLLKTGDIQAFALSIVEQRWLAVPAPVVHDAVVQRPSPVPAEFVLSDEEILFESERQPHLSYSDLRVLTDDPTLISIAPPAFRFKYVVGGHSINLRNSSVLFSETQAMVFAYVWSQVVENGAVGVKEEEIFKNIPRVTGSPRINDIFRSHSVLQWGLLERTGLRFWTLNLDC